MFDKIGEVCDVAYILSQNAKRLHINTPPVPLKRGIGTIEPASECKFVFEKDFDKTAETLKKNLDKNTVVLFESRGAGAMMGKML